MTKISDEVDLKGFSTGFLNKQSTQVAVSDIIELLN